MQFGFVPTLAVVLLLLSTTLAQDKGDAKSSEKLDGKWYVVGKIKFGGPIPAGVAKSAWSSRATRWNGTSAIPRRTWPPPSPPLIPKRKPSTPRSPRDP